VASQFHHVSFTVSNLDMTESFFTEFFDLQRIGGGHYDFDYIKKHVGYTDAILKISILAFRDQTVPTDFILELIEYVQPRGTPADTATNRPGNAHVCFKVDNIYTQYERLKAAGYRFKASHPVTVTSGFHKGARVMYLNGPDGIALELFQFDESTECE